MSLIICDTDETDELQINNDKLDRFYSIFNGLKSTRLHSLTFHMDSNEALEYFARNFFNTDHLVSLCIESGKTQHNKSWTFILSIFDRYNLRKLSLTVSETIMEPIS